MIRCALLIGLALALGAAETTADRIAGERAGLARRFAALVARERDLAAEDARLERELAEPEPVDAIAARRLLAARIAGAAGTDPAASTVAAAERWRAAALAEIDRLRTCAHEPADVVLWDGSRVRAVVERLGGAGAAIAEPQPALVAPLAAGSWRQAGPTIAAPARAGWIPVDISGRLASRAAEAPRSLLRRLRDGGWWVLPILAAGALAAALTGERLWAARRERGDGALGMRVLERVGAGDLAAARALVAALATPSARVLAAGLARFDAGYAGRLTALGEAVLAETPRVERGLTMLAMLAAIAPLLGLLGTVSGMIRMFQVLASHGTGNPRLLSGGISEALVTTQLGLLVAVPALFAHAALARRAERVATRLEEQATALAGAGGERAGG